jgi:hypothetical protein
MSTKLPEPGIDALEAVSEMVSTAAKSLESHSESIAAAFSSMNKQSEELALRLSTALAPLREFSDRLTSTLQENQEVSARRAQQGAELVRGIQRFLRELPEHMRTACVELADEGWYIDGDFGAGACRDLVHAIRAGNRKWVNGQLMEDYTQRLPAVKIALYGRYPHRVKILRAAFAAHERGEYELSVPVFLAQADGICIEVTRHSLFIKNSGKPAVAEFAESFGLDEFHAAVLTPLIGVHAIGLSQKERPKDFSGLNRHQVLHGESVNYDTELNSCKAISLLSYLEWVLHLDRKPAIDGHEALRKLESLRTSD